MRHAMPPSGRTVLNLTCTLRGNVAKQGSVKMEDLEELEAKMHTVLDELAPEPEFVEMMRVLWLCQIDMERHARRMQKKPAQPAGANCMLSGLD